QRANFDRVRVNRIAHFGSSRDVQQPFAKRSSSCPARANSRGHVPKRSLAGLGFSRTKSAGQHARPPQRDMDLYHLFHGLRLWVSLLLRLSLWRFWFWHYRRCPYTSSRSQLRFLWRSLFRSILLFVH